MNKYISQAVIEVEICWYVKDTTVLKSTVYIRKMFLEYLGYSDWVWTVTDKGRTRAVLALTVRSVFEDEQSKQMCWRTWCLRQQKTKRSKQTRVCREERSPKRVTYIQHLTTKYRGRSNGNTGDGLKPKHYGRKKPKILFKKSHLCIDAGVTAEYIQEFERVDPN